VGPGYRHTKSAGLIWAASISPANLKGGAYKFLTGESKQHDKIFIQAFEVRMTSGILAGCLPEHKKFMPLSSRPACND
jgi:hypothetical protein